MSELDKKTLAIKPNQADLVGLVLEAFEKKNQERVDMLVTNAIKQLKMSRFKPDQTICISLTYLARINPKLFNQSSTIKDMLKTLLRRDQGPANIKGKSDTILPVLAANILLATCDGTEVRNIILSKLDQWLTSSTKVADIVMHVLTIICEKCQGDQQTIAYLIEMRRHWITYITNLQLQVGSIPSDLSEGVRNLLDKEDDPSQLILYINFLDKYDGYHEALSQAMARLISRRPMTLLCMFNEPDHGPRLCRGLIALLNKILLQLKYGNPKQVFHMQQEQQQQTSKLQDLEKVSAQVKCDSMGGVKMEMDSKVAQVANIKQAEADSNNVQPELEEKVKKFDIDKEVLRPYVAPVYIKPAGTAVAAMGKGNDLVWQMDKNTFEAVILLMILIEQIDELRPDWIQLAQSFLVDCDDFTKLCPKQHMSSFYSDYGLTQYYDIPIELRRKMYLAQSELLVDLSLVGASVGQLILLLCQFDSNLSSLDKIFKQLEAVKDVDLIRGEINDDAFFYQLMEFYVELGSLGAKKFLLRLEQQI